MADVEASGGRAMEALEDPHLMALNWCWGTVQGAFNEKATLSQIIADAVIGMIPVVGDITAARDLIAVVIGLVDDPKKREEKSQWILLAVLLFALLPVIGGVLKGSGRLVIKAIGETAHLAGQGARFAKLAEAARDIVAFLNRMGVGKAEKWLVQLKFAAFESVVVKAFEGLVKRMTEVLGRTKVRLGAALPEALVERMDELIRGLKVLKEEGVRRIPEGLKELDQTLREIQVFIHSGGETTSRATAHAAAAGEKSLTYTEELILLEGNAAKRTARGGFAPNSGLADEIATNYTHVDGFPDLRKVSTKPLDGDPSFPLIATYAGQIVNRELQAGEEIFRVFGPGGTTHSVVVDERVAAGGGALSFWGINEVPQNAETWRQHFAVLDEWNRDGYIVVGRILPGNSLKACTGLVAEQAAEKIGSQYLRGGGKQAILELPASVATELNELGRTVSKTERSVTKEIGGVEWEVRPTGWDDANEIHGYLSYPGPSGVQTARLGSREIASKQDSED